MSITLTAKQLRAALEFANPDGPDSEMEETEVDLWFRDQDEESDDGEALPRGWYCNLSEYPEEGCFALDPPAEPK